MNETTYWGIIHINIVLIYLSHYSYHRRTHGLQTKALYCSSGDVGTTIRNIECLMLNSTVSREHLRQILYITPFTNKIGPAR